MASFEIRNHHGIKVSTDDLNNEVAWLWNSSVTPYKEDGETYYSVRPCGHTAKTGGTWHSVVGMAISHPPIFRAATQQSWDDLRLSILFSLMEVVDSKTKEEFLTATIDILSFINEHLRLIDYWKSKGYIPVRIT